MSELLILLARAFDTKGYPDDKGPNHWFKINGSHVHYDGYGNINGGVDGKFNGKTWSGSKYKTITKVDLDRAWKKVVKYKNSMNQAKTQKTYEKNATNMKGALEEYKKMASMAPVSMKKHNVASMEKHVDKPYKSTSPLEELASVGESKETPKIKSTDILNQK